MNISTSAISPMANARTVKALRRLALAIGSVILGLSTVTVFAQSGQFTFVYGPVTIERNAQRTVPVAGTQVSPSDIIVTGPNGMAQLAMVDGAKLALRSNSRLQVEKYPVSATDPPGAVLNLVQGGLRTFTGLLTGPNRAGYRMNTKVATVGIRGSGGILESNGDTTNHFTIEGSHLVASLDGSFAPILTTPNQTVQVVQGQAPKVIPTPPSLLEAGKVTVIGKEKAPAVEAKTDTQSQQASTSGTDKPPDPDAKPTTQSQQAGTSGTGTVTGADTGTGTVTRIGGVTGIGTGTGVATGTGFGTGGTAVLGGNGLGFTIVDATGNLGGDPINLQSVVISARGSTISDQAVLANLTLDNGSLRAYTAYAGSQSGTGANVGGGTAREVQTATVGGGTTVVLGRWEAPASFGFGAGNGGSGGTVAGSVHWAYGGTGFPSYLSDVLTGSASYTRQAATTPTNQLNTLGSLITATLDVNFSARTLNAVIGVTMPAGSGAAAGTWNLVATNVPFSFNAFFASGSRVVVTNAGGTSSAANSRIGGSIEGSFVGNALNGAILGYNIYDQTSLNGADFQRINGVVAYSGPSQNSAAAYRDGLVSDPTGSLARASYIRSFTTTNTQAEVTVAGNGVVSAFTAPFPTGNEIIGHRPYAQGTAAVVDNGFDPTTGLVWGRWAGGNATIGGQNVSLGQNSLHYIFSPTQSGPVSLPLTGTGVYDVVGSTRPTDIGGQVGVFNSASLNANFSSKTVDTSINISIGGQTWIGTAAGVPIYRDQYFSAYSGGQSIAGIPRPADFNITCTPNCTPSGVTGSLDGFFTGRRGAGAGVMYNMSNISGAVAFARRGG